jgi:hypothetical protein
VWLPVQCPDPAAPQLGCSSPAFEWVVSWCLGDEDSLPPSHPSLQGPNVKSRAAMQAEALTPHFCVSVHLSTGCEELLKDVLSMESAGTLPCAPEIPDCMEQVRCGTLEPPCSTHPSCSSCLCSAFKVPGRAQTLPLTALWHQNEEIVFGTGSLKPLMEL